MTRLCLLIIKILIVLSLAGCAVPMLILSLPGGAPLPQQAEIPGYTLGPVAADEFPALVLNAIPASEGEIHVFGKADWSGLQGGERFIEAVAAITDTNILLLMWYQPENQYKIVTRFPFSEILSVSALPGGDRTSLYFDDKELSLGDQTYRIDGKTALTFYKPSRIGLDREKNEATFLFLQDRIKLHESDPAPGQSFDDTY